MVCQLYGDGLRLTIKGLSKLLSLLVEGGDIYRYWIITIVIKRNGRVVANLLTLAPDSFDVSVVRVSNLLRIAWMIIDDQYKSFLRVNLSRTAATPLLEKASSTGDHKRKQEERNQVPKIVSWDLRGRG
jgi:hypothetical protein